MATNTAPSPVVSIIVVSYNTRDLTLRCLETVFEQTTIPFELIVIDNASNDGSADAIEASFGDRIHFIRSDTNHGFARANNIASKRARGEWLLLLNPDTEVLDHAIDRLVAFAETLPDAGIYGGRTVFPDRSLNIASCWNRITLWSLFCHATGLSAAFSGSEVFNTEGMGSWARDTVRRVDIVVGCFLLTRVETWERLGGFDTSYWMYGEESDLCLRARRLGMHPIINPDAVIVHLVGASAPKRAGKLTLVAKARVTLVKRHFSSVNRPLGLGLIWIWGAARRVASGLLARISPGRWGESAELWREVWGDRGDWLRGYPASDRNEECPADTASPPSHEIGSAS